MVSKYFSLAEVTKTNYNIPNVMNEVNIKEVGYLCTSLLDVIREHFNAPLIVSSVFRCQALEDRISGKANTPSQHTAAKVGGGAAADILNCGDNKPIDILKYIKETQEWDQMIIEGCVSFDKPETGRWLHVSKKMKGNRKQILVMVNGKYAVYNH